MGENRWDKMETNLLGELTSPEAEERLRRTGLAILPVGSLEQHGPHLPLDTDSWDAYHLSQEAVRLVKGEKPLILPPIPYGVSYHHMGFAGTISISPPTLYNLICEIGESLRAQGIKKLLVVNGHGGNEPALRAAAQSLKQKVGLVLFIESGGLVAPLREKLITTRNDVHAGEYETSTTLANREEMVRREKIPQPEVKYPSPYLEFSSPQRVSWGFDVGELSPQGVLGDPTKASKEKGEELWLSMIKALADLIEQLSSIEV